MTLIAQTALAGTTPGQETGFIVWSPYSGEDALFLSLILLATAVGLIMFGRHLRRDIGLPRPWTWLKVVIVLVWLLQILILLRIFKHIITVDPSSGVTGPVLPVTLASAICAFAFVAYVLRRERAGVAIGGAFVAAVAGPMVFELPFVLIVASVGSVPTNPGATLTIPFFLAMINTLALLSFSSKSAITRDSAYFLGAMFLVFAVWALFGLAYPSDPVTFLLNSASKVLGFATTAAMFRRKAADSEPSPVPLSGAQS